MDNGFVFNDCERFIPQCDACGKKYEGEGIQVALFRGGWEICPTCLLKGPKGVTDMLRKKNTRSSRSFLSKLDSVEDFREIPGGIMALKVAEGYQETKAANRKGKAA
jgi:ribosome-binding protein aMBF1 (putative translation factor)